MVERIGLTCLVPATLIAVDHMGPRSSWRVQFQRAAPATDEVLGELRYSADQIASLRAAGII
jgi:hypothetical protein